MKYILHTAIFALSMAGYDEQKFSLLEKVNHASVKDLALAWSADFDTDRGQEITPLVVEGVITGAQRMIKGKVLIGGSGEYGVRAGITACETQSNDKVRTAHLPVPHSKAIESHDRETVVRMSAAQ